MSDTKLRELEMEWKAEAGNFAHEGGLAVAYLAELLRVGQVRHLDCVLAWRQHRVEELFRDQNGVPLRWPRGAHFDPENPVMAVGALMVLFADDPEITIANLVGPQGPAGESLSTELLADSIRRILEGQDGVPLRDGPRFPFTPTGCTPSGHLGPINYDATVPICERCNQGVLVTRDGDVRSLGAPRCSECGCGIVGGLQRHYDGCSRN